jgi:MFS superfamily sulfate permease-like transporter
LLFLSTDQDDCFPKTIGYKPAEIMSTIDGTSFSRAGTDTADGLTGAFILHPIACGLAFIAALLSIVGVIGSLVGSILAVLAWIITVVVMAIDFAVFGVRR